MHGPLVDLGLLSQFSRESLHEFCHATGGSAEAIEGDSVGMGQVMTEILWVGNRPLRSRGSELIPMPLQLDSGDAFFFEQVNQNGSK